MRTSELFERAAQDDLLLLRGDVMTVLREVSAEDPRLFPLRYARRTPRHPRPVDVAAREQAGVAPPAVPLLVLPDGPGRASVLPYDRLRRGLSARGVDVIMMEHRGVGLSRQDGTGADLPRDAMRLPEVLADVLAVLDHARVERVAVYGAGYGGYLALALAALHGERVASLVLDSPLVTADDELAGQAALRAAYWDGTVPATAATAARLRRLVGSGSVDGRHAGSVVLAVHEHGGPEAVRDLVDLLAVGRGRLTWSSVRQVLAQNWLQSTPYVDEHDLVAPISHTQLGRGHHADGGPLDSLQLLANQGRGLPPFTEEPWDLRALAPQVTAPTLVMAGEQDLVRPPRLARELTDALPDAALLEMPRAGHLLLDSRTPLAQVAGRWATSGAATELPRWTERLAALPATPADQTLTGGLRVALAAERYSPWRLRVESARTRRLEAAVDPTARRSRSVRL